jgi:hypothetical protein
VRRTERSPLSPPLPFLHRSLLRSEQCDQLNASWGRGRPPAVRAALLRWQASSRPAGRALMQRSVQRWHTARTWQGGAGGRGRQAPPRPCTPPPAAWPPGTAPAPRLCAAAAPAGGQTRHGRAGPGAAEWPQARLLGPARSWHPPQPAAHGSRRGRGVWEEWGSDAISGPAADGRSECASCWQRGRAPPLPPLPPLTSLQIRLSFLGLIFRLRCRHTPASVWVPWRTRLGAGGAPAEGRSGTISSGDALGAGVSCCALCSDWRICEARAGAGLMGAAISSGATRRRCSSLQRSVENGERGRGAHRRPGG